MNEKRKTSKSRKAKDKRLEKKALEGIFRIYSYKGQGIMFHLWKGGEGISVSCGTLYPKISWWPDIIFSRKECEWLLLSLQHQLRGCL